MKQKLFKIIVIFSFTLNFLFLSGTFVIIQKKGGVPWVNRKLSMVFNTKDAKKTAGTYPNNKLSLYNQLPIHSTDIIFLGDSNLDYGEWHELMGTKTAKNRSINGADTHTILGRLEYIIQGKPRHVVLLCGINNFQKKIPLQRSINEYKKIVDEILSKSKNTNIWLMPIFPINKKLYRQWIVPDHPGINIPNQKMVESMNTAIASLQNHPQVHFCDMPNLLNEKGELSNKYTFDGLHLNGLGLIKIAETLKSLLV